jgi:LAGLIDADG endonuclease
MIILKIVEIIKNLGSGMKDAIFTPWYITGISDGEGSFHITIQDIKDKGFTGYKPFLEFKVTQKEQSLGMLLELKKFFRCGRINIDNRNTRTMKFVITSNNDIINKVIPHFDMYPLKTSKYLNYIDFKSAANLMKDKKHYEREGIEMLKEIKSQMNKARSFKDKFYYCWNKDIILKAEWIQGFIDGEGSFQSEINLPKRNNSNYGVNFSLQIKQNNHDVAILNAIKNFFHCGYLKPKYEIKNLYATENCLRNATTLWIRKSDIICNFFDKYPLYTVKRLDYLDWKHLINLKLKKAHLSIESLELMKKIKNNMNANRFKYFR